jgi:YfiH family protein
VIEHSVLPKGFQLAGDADGHVTGEPGALLGVTVADCVPVFLVDPVRRVNSLLHGGWRGVASGILEAGVETLSSRFGCDPAALHLHLGPSICGSCYEVGPEVHEALGLPLPAARKPVDLRAVLAARGLRLGIPAHQISRSAYCTLCGHTPFYSHRREDPERQVAFVGTRLGSEL